MEILGKENCPLAEKKLKQALFGDCEEGEIELSDARMSAQEVAQAINNKYIEKTYSEHPDYKRLYKKMEALRNALGDVYQYMNDPEVRDYFKSKDYEDEDILNNIIIKPGNDFLEKVNWCYMKLSTSLRFPKKKRGRPSIGEFKKFVYFLAELYEDISGKKFTIQRNREETGKNEGKYLPVTPGHKFVWEVVTWMHDSLVDRGIEYSFRYTDKNIYNACENAQKKLKQNRSGQS